MAQPVSSSISHPSLRFGLAITIALYLASAAGHVFYGALNADEGFYAIATRSVAQGEMPYRDFGFTQPPLVLYANALPLRWIGFGLFPQRIVNGIWAAAALALAATWLARRTTRTWGVAAILLFSLSAPWMYFIHLGKTYGFTTLLVMVAAWVFLAMKDGPRRIFLLGVLAVLGLGTRLPAAPFFAVLALVSLWPGRRLSWSEGFSFVGGIGLSLAALAPIWIAAPEATKFWIVDFHRASVPYKDWSVDWADIVALAPAIWVLAMCALGVIVRRRRWFTRETGVYAAAVIVLMANLLPSGAYQEYGIPFLVPLAVVSAALIFDELKTHSRGALLLVLSSTAVAQLLVAPMLSAGVKPSRAGSFSRWLPPHAPAYNPLLPTQLSAARRIVESSLAPDAPFIGPNIILAAETGRLVPPDLRMGPFSFTLELPPEQAARFHLALHDELDAFFARRDVTLLAFFRRGQLNYGWSMPSFDQLREDFHAQWFAPLHRDFATAYESGDDFLLLVRKP